ALTPAIVIGPAGRGTRGYGVGGGVLPRPVLEPRGFPGVVREAAEVRRAAAVAVRGFEAPRRAEGLASACSVVPLVASAGLPLAAAAPLAASLAEGLVVFFAEELVL